MGRCAEWVGLEQSPWGKEDGEKMGVLVYKLDAFCFQHVKLARLVLSYLLKYSVLTRYGIRSPSCIGSGTSTVSDSTGQGHTVSMLTMVTSVLAAFGTIGGMLFGFDISSMSAWIGSDIYLEYFNHPDSSMQGGITASMSGGSLVGALVAGTIADYYGRRGALKIASLVFIVGAVLQASAQNVTHLIIGRVISGLSIGVTSSQSCVYLAELAPSRIRGRIVGIQQWSIEWGTCHLPRMISQCNTD